MKNNIEIVTERLVLKSITPGFINEIFKNKTKEEIAIFLVLMKQDICT